MPGIDNLTLGSARFPGKFPGAPSKSLLFVAFNKKNAEDLGFKLKLAQEGSDSLPPRTVYQEAICKAVAKLDSHVVVNAVAGSGKTTTLMHVCAEFKGATTASSTLHSLGFGALRGALQGRGVSNLKVDDHKYDDILKVLTGWDQLNDDQRAQVSQVISSANKLINLSRCHGFTSFRPEPDNEDLAALADRYSVDFPEHLLDGGEGKVYELVRKALEIGNQVSGTIDFLDMLHLPLRLNASFRRYDLVCVDESQDLDPSQIEICRRLAARGAKILFVGDRNQAIYGFRGADSEAIDSIVTLFNARELPLSTCWRCPLEVIELAKTIVPQIEASPDAKQGKVEHINGFDYVVKNAQEGDLVICRTTAPVVAACMKLIRNRRKATVLGRDIGQNLLATIAKIQKSRVARGESLITKIDAWGQKQLERLDHPKKENQRQQMEDRVATLLVLAEDCEDFTCMIERVRLIFSDEFKGIVCSTVHKAKGSEASSVYIVEPELLPHPMAKLPWQRQQEMNIKYVAITRALENLFFVYEAKSANARREDDAARQINGDPSTEIKVDTLRKVSGLKKARKAKAAKS